MTGGGLRFAAPLPLLFATLALAACGPPLGAELFVHGAALRRASVIVVLGNRPPRGPDGRIAPESERRVRRGVQLFEQGLAPRILFAGGPAPGGGTEADVMAAFARTLGVPDAAILLERDSRDTAGNARGSVRLLCEGQPAPCHPDVIVVSTPYHLRRARRLFECAGARVQPAAAALPDSGTQAAYTAHEYAVGIASIFDDACARARPP